MISIILTHFNKGLLLNRTIDSLEIDNPIVHEVIIVDDNSTDLAWVENAKSLLCYSKKIKIIQNSTNKGPAIRLNQGARFATGQYLFFMDADDILAPKRLELFLTKMKENNADLCYAKKVKTHHVEEIVQHHDHTWEISHSPLTYIIKNNIMQMCVMCSTSLFLKSTGCNENIFIQDESLSLNLGKFSKTMISSSLNSVFVILDKNETKSVRGDNRLSRHLEQQHHDNFFTILDFLNQYPNIELKNKKRLLQKIISTYWKSKKNTNQVKSIDYYIYILSKFSIIPIWLKYENKITEYFNQLKNVRRLRNPKVQTK